MRKQSSSSPSGSTSTRSRRSSESCRRSHCRGSIGPSVGRPKRRPQLVEVELAGQRRGPLLHDENGGQRLDLRRRVDGGLPQRSAAEHTQRPVGPAVHDRGAEFFASQGFDPLARRTSRQDPARCKQFMAGRCLAQDHFFRRIFQRIAADLAKDGLCLIGLQPRNTNNFQPGRPICLAAEKQQVCNGLRHVVWRQFSLGRFQAIEQQAYHPRRRRLVRRPRRKIGRYGNTRRSESSNSFSRSGSRTVQSSGARRSRRPAGRAKQHCGCLGLHGVFQGYVQRGEPL